MQTMEIPSEVQAWGTPTAEFKAETRWQWLNVGAGVVFLLGGLGVMLVGPIAAWSQDEAGMLVFSCFGLIAAALGAWTIYAFFRDRGWRVLIFPQGLVQVRTGKTTVIPWDEATQFYHAVTRNYRNGVYVGTTYNFTLVGKGGQKLSFGNGLAGVEGLGNSIRDETWQRLYPKYAAAYNAGETLQFGTISISKQGISNGKETIAWDQVKGINLDRGIINIQKEGKWFNWKSATVGGTPNVFVFLSLVDQIAGLNKKK